ncbi:unnamed protein product, partial [Hymenolepis diminuta]
ILKKFNSEQLKVAVDENPTCTSRELSKTFRLSRHMTIYREMKRPVWESLKGWQMGLPHDLSEINKHQPVTSSVSLRSRKLNFRHRIITDSDEK